MWWRWHWHNTSQMRRRRRNPAKNRRTWGWWYGQHGRWRNTGHNVWSSCDNRSGTFGFVLECKLQEELLGVFVPVGPEFGVRFLYFTARYLESNRFVWFCGKQQILPLAVWRLNLLLIGRHKTVSRIHQVSYFCKKQIQYDNYLTTFYSVYGAHGFGKAPVSKTSKTMTLVAKQFGGQKISANVVHTRIINLEQQTLLSSFRITLLGNPVAGPTDLDKLLGLHTGLLRGQLLGGILRFLSGTPSQICLMLLTLRMRQVTSLVIVKR